MGQPLVLNYVSITMNIERRILRVNLSFWIRTLLECAYAIFGKTIPESMIKSRQPLLLTHDVVSFTLDIIIYFLEEVSYGSTSRHLNSRDCETEYYMMRLRDMHFSIFVKYYVKSVITQQRGGEGRLSACIYPVPS